MSTLGRLSVAVPLVGADGGTAALRRYEHMAESVPSLRRVWFLREDLSAFAESVDTDNGEVTYVHRRGTVEENQLEDAVWDVDWPPGRVHAFAHGEAQEIMHGLQPHLPAERGPLRRPVSISGYWRRGRSEDGFRAWKSDFARP